MTNTYPEPSRTQGTPYGQKDVYQFWTSAYPPHLVQAIARHADVDITLKIYAHTNLDVMRASV